eukprot:1158036-Pelagomonas_calceolata.AAC.5
MERKFTACSQLGSGHKGLDSGYNGSLPAAAAFRTYDMPTNWQAGSGHSLCCCQGKAPAVKIVPPLFPPGTCDDDVQTKMLVSKPRWGRRSPLEQQARAFTWPLFCLPGMCDDDVHTKLLVSKHRRGRTWPIKQQVRAFTRPLLSPLNKVCELFEVKPEVLLQPASQRQVLAALLARQMDAFFAKAVGCSASPASMCKGHSSGRLKKKQLATFSQQWPSTASFEIACPCVGLTQGERSRRTDCQGLLDSVSWMRSKKKRHLMAGFNHYSFEFFLAAIFAGETNEVKMLQLKDLSLAG